MNSQYMEQDTQQCETSFDLLIRENGLEKCTDMEHDFT